MAYPVHSVPWSGEGGREYPCPGPVWGRGLEGRVGEGKGVMLGEGRGYPVLVLSGEEEGGYHWTKDPEQPPPPGGRTNKVKTLPSPVLDTRAIQISYSCYSLKLITAWRLEQKREDTPKMAVVLYFVKFYEKRNTEPKLHCVPVVSTFSERTTFTSVAVPCSARQISPTYP